MKKILMEKILMEKQLGAPLKFSFKDLTHVLLKILPLRFPTGLFLDQTNMRARFLIHLKQGPNKTDISISK